MAKAYFIHETARALTPESVQLGSAMGDRAARRLSEVWKELALALAEPLEDLPVREILPPPQGALDLFVKVMSSPWWAPAETEEAALVFASRRHAAERSARAMGLGVDQIDQLWSAAYGVAYCAMPDEENQRAFHHINAEFNKRVCFSEALAWSQAEERLAREAGSVRDPARGPERALEAAFHCAEALADVAMVSGPKGRSARAWMTNRDARIIKAALEAIEASLDGEIGSGARAEKAIKADQAFSQSQAPTLRAIVEASEAANAASKAGPNVKSRRIGA